MEKSLGPVSTTPSFTSSRRVVRQFHQRATHIGMIMIDQGLVFLCLLLADNIVFQLLGQSVGITGASFGGLVPFIPVLMLVLAFIYEFKGIYRLPRGASLLRYSKLISTSTLLGMAATIVAAFFFQVAALTPLYFFLAGALITASLAGSRVLLMLGRHVMWARGIGQERVLVVGSSRLANHVMNGIVAQPRLGYKLVGYLGEARLIPQGNRHQRNFRHIGAISDLERKIRDEQIDQVIFALPFWENGKLANLVERCRDLGVEHRVAPDFYQLQFERVEITNSIGVPILNLKDESLSGWKILLKRSIDTGLVLLSAIITLPIGILLAILIRLDSRGPVFFRQTRVGKDGKHFTCYKFRTMVPNAEQLQAELMKHNEADGPLFKMKNDPRITRVGHFLRQSSLDELPQLINVLKGEMSLVGPRPGLPSEIASYQQWHMRRLEVLPGITGLWQALGRSNMSFDEMVSLDLYYARHWSLDMDLRILWMTIPAVLFSKGAY